MRCSQEFSQAQFEDTIRDEMEKMSAGLCLPEKWRFELDRLDCRTKDAALNGAGDG